MRGEAVKTAGGTGGYFAFSGEGEQQMHDVCATAGGRDHAGQSPPPWKAAAGARGECLGTATRTRKLAPLIAASCPARSHQPQHLSFFQTRFPVARFLLLAKEVKRKAGVSLESTLVCFSERKGGLVRQDPELLCRRPIAAIPVY